MTEMHESLTYDIDLGASLRDLYEDPKTRWFAVKMASREVARGLVAAGEWNELLHPRGRDGKFINKFGFIRWFDIDTNKWVRGMVENIAEDGSLTVVTVGNYKSKKFTHDEIAKKVYSAPVTKAKLDLPDVGSVSETEDWKKVGGQGGSNLGGFFQLKNKPKSIDEAGWAKIYQEHNLSNVAFDGKSDATYIYWGPSGDPYLWSNYGESGLGWYNLNGVKHDLPVEEGTLVFTAPSLMDTYEAWDKLRAIHNELGQPDTKFYIKKGSTKKHVANEVLANRLYELAGVPVAEVLTDSGTTIASKLVPSTDEKKNLGDALDDKIAMDRLREDFVVDAWLANWDVVGLGLENVQVVDGVPYRIDAGGAISYRAQGSPKGKAFGPIVGEIDTLLDPKINPKSAKAFAGISFSQLLVGAKKVASVDPDAIDALVLGLGLDQDVADTLKARRQYIIDKYSLEDPWHEAPYVDVDSLPKASAPSPLPGPDIDDAPADIAPVSAPPVTSNVDLDGKIWDPATGSWVDGQYKHLYNTHFKAINDHASKFAYKHESSDSALYDLDYVIGALVLLNGTVYEVTDYSPETAEAKIKDVVFGVETTGHFTMSADGLEVLVSGKMKHTKKLLIDHAKNGYGAYITEMVKNPSKLDEEIKLNSEKTPPYVYSYPKESVGPKLKFKTVDAKSSLAEHQLGGEGKYTIAGGELSKLSGSSYNSHFYVHADKTTYKASPEGDGEHVKGTIFGTTDSSSSPKAVIVGGHSEGDHDISIPMNVLSEAILAAVHDSGAQANDSADIAPSQVTEEISQLVADAVAKSSVITEADESVTNVVEDKPVEHLYLSLMLQAAAATNVATHTAMADKFGGQETVSVPEFVEWAAGNLDENQYKQFTDYFNVMYGGSFADYTAETVYGKKNVFLHPDVPYQKTAVIQELLEAFNSIEDVAGRLLGKSVFVTLKSGPLKEVGLGTVPQGVAYVKEYNPDKNKLVLVSTTGKVFLVPLNENNKFSFHILDQDLMAPGLLMTALTPVMKKTGELTLGGVVVGSWKKEVWPNSGYSYELFPDYTMSGTIITGKSAKKTTINHYAALNLIPKQAEAAKKSSASKVATTVKEYVNKTIPGEPKLYNGETAELGTWVASTKGGGGFVGKIVGWPNQDTHPGLAIAVGKDGVQKIVSLKTQKSVPEPNDLDDNGVPIVDDIPNAYAKEEFKLADGKFPVIGQKVKSGKAGSEVEGIITNINPDQGWVYILQDNGKKVSKTFSVTTVLEEPKLIWDPDIPIEVVVEASKPTPKKKSSKVKAPSLVPESGELYQQPQALKDEWTSKGVSLTKDGYAPELAMHVVLKDGSLGVITSLPNPHSGKPNGMSVYSLDKGKIVQTSVANIEVNHIKQTAGYMGQPAKKFSAVTNFEYHGYHSWPDGTKLYAFYEKNKQIYKGDFREVVKQNFFAVTPDGKMIMLYTYPSGVLATTVADPKNTLKATLGSHFGVPGAIDLVGVVSPDGDALHINKPEVSPYSALKSPFVWTKPGEIPDPPAESETVTGPITLSPDASKAVPAFQAPTPTEPDLDTSPPIENTYITPYSELDPEELLTDEELTPDPLTGVEVEDPMNVDVDALPDALDAPLPKLVDYTALAQKIPSPTPQKAASGQTSSPPPPTPTGVQGDLSTPSSVLTGTKTHTIAAAASKMLAIKDSTDPGTGSVFATGDSDLVDDMEFRFNVVKQGAKEKLRLRFRLREEAGEDLVSLIIGATGGLLGTWKVQDSKYPIDFKPGDAIAVRLGTFTAKGDGVKQLKPDPNATAPNARIISDPVAIGKSPGPNGTGLYLTYRVKVKTATGEVGELDVQMRPSATLTSFEWDPDAPDFTSSSKLSLMPTAFEMGWADLGEAVTDGTPGSVQVDETGKWTPQGKVGVVKNGLGRTLLKTSEDGTTTRVIGVHPSVSGIGNSTPRRSNFAGEVLIDVPLDGRSEEEIFAAISKSLESVGIPPEKQSAPSNEKLVELALGKLVSQYHPKYEYRGKPITGPDDERVVETLNHMSNLLKKHLGRDVTLDDVRIHTSDDGTMRFMLSPEVGIAIAKKQGATYHEHTGASSLVTEILAGTHPGLMATETRWSAGILTSGQSSHTDLMIGSGDRVYTRGRSGAPSYPGTVAINAAIMGMSMETYTNIAAAGGVSFDSTGNNISGTSSDSYGRRGGLNKFIEKVVGHEAMTKRKIDADMIGVYVVGSLGNKEVLIKKLKSRGITKVGSRPIEKVILTNEEAVEVVSSADWYQNGMEIFENDIPITTLIGVAPDVSSPAAGTV